jgi:hypothetical protein
MRRRPRPTRGLSSQEKKNGCLMREKFLHEKFHMSGNLKYSYESFGGTSKRFNHQETRSYNITNETS